MHLFIHAHQHSLGFFGGIFGHSVGSHCIFCFFCNGLCALIGRFSETAHKRHYYYYYYTICTNHSLFLITLQWLNPNLLLSFCTGTVPGEDLPVSPNLCFFTNLSIWYFSFCSIGCIFSKN